MHFGLTFFIIFHHAHLLDCHHDVLEGVASKRGSSSEEAWQGTPAMGLS